MASRSEEKDARVKGMVDGLKAPKGKFKSMNIEGAENGVSISTRREAPAKASDNDGDEGGKSMPQAYDAGNTNTVHTNLDDAVEHVRKHLAGHFAK
jgi:hypothetical protein